MRVGIDTGGTFTDVVDDDGRVAKVLSTPDDPARAVARAVARARRRGRAGRARARHDGRDERAARAARRRGRAGHDRGLRRRDRDRPPGPPSLYDPFVDRPAPLVPRALRFEVAGRLDADGAELDAVRRRACPAIPDEVDAVAVCLLHADLNARHERAVAAALRARRATTSPCSHEVSPEFREYERTVTTVVNAYLRPACRAVPRRGSPRSPTRCS